MAWRKPSKGDCNSHRDGWNRIVLMSWAVFGALLPARILVGNKRNPRQLCLNNFAHLGLVDDLRESLSGQFDPASKQWIGASQRPSRRNH